MDRRTLFFVILASWIFVIYMMIFAPPPAKIDEQQAEKEAAAEVDPDAGEVEADAKDGADSSEEAETGNQDSPADDENADADSKPDADAKQNSEGAAESNPKQDDAKTAQDSDADQTETELDPAPSITPEEPTAPEEPTRRQIEQKFISLGSMAKDTPYRFLVTFDNTAASVRRLELVQRHRNSEKLRYKDLEVHYGYLGHLDLVSEESGGVRIRTVGEGTPADVAGLKVGDVITKLNDIETPTRIEFMDALRETEPGQEAVVEYTRDSGGGVVSASLTNHPMEVIQPNSVPKEFSEPFEQIQEKLSYSISLFHPVGSLWEKVGELDSEPWDSVVSEDSVQFFYPYQDEAEARAAGFDYQVIKTYRLIPTEEENRNDVTAMSYHLDFKIDVKNLGPESRSFAYRIDGPNGLPTEDWWFAIKIHGEWSAMFSQAGARDIVASTEADTFQFVGGPKIYSNATSPTKQKKIPIIEPGYTHPGSHSLNYIGVDSHYFVSTLIPTDGEAKSPREAYSAQALPQWIPLSDQGNGKIDTELKKKAGWYRKLVPVNFKVYFQFENPNVESSDNRYLIEPNQVVSHSFMIFAGPKEPSLLQKYEIGDCVTYGWFAMFSWPLVSLLHLFYAVVGNYAVAIVLLTVLVRLAMIRFSRKMVVNTQMMQVLSPEIKAIAERYKDDFQGRSKAQQELFRKYNYNPFSGCLVMLIQLPVFIGLYRGLSVDIALRDKPLIPGVEWCSNLAGPDQLWRWQESLPEFFSFLTDETGWLGPYFNLLPIISVVLMLIQQKLFTPPAADEQQAMMQKMMTFMMVFIGVIFFKVPAGLCIYFITSTLWAIMEKKMIPPPKLPADLQSRLDQLKELQAKERADGVEAGTYTNALSSTTGGNNTRKHTERAKKRSQKNRRK